MGNLRWVYREAGRRAALAALVAFGSRRAAFLTYLRHMGAVAADSLTTTSTNLGVKSWAVFAAGSLTSPFTRFLSA